MSSLLIVDRTDRDPDGLQSTIYQARKRVYSTPSALVDAFEENEVSATQELKGKALLVEGTIENIGLDIMANPHVTLASGDGIRSVQCTSEHKDDVASLHKGDDIAVRGKCKGLMMNYCSMTAKR